MNESAVYQSTSAPGRGRSTPPGEGSSGMRAASSHLSCSRQCPNQYLDNYHTRRNLARSEPPRPGCTSGTRCAQRALAALGSQGAPPGSACRATRADFRVPNWNLPPPQFDGKTFTQTGIRFVSTSPSPVALQELRGRVQLPDRQHLVDEVRVRVREALHELRLRLRRLGT